MTKQTAVEWLIDRIVQDQLHRDISHKVWLELFEQAKEMEKEQICTSYVYGAAYGIDTTNDFKPEIYYKETYGGNK
jgi:hypothetical protein